MKVKKDKQKAGGLGGGRTGATLERGLVIFFRVKDCSTRTPAAAVTAVAAETEATTYRGYFVCPAGCFLSWQSAKRWLYAP